MGVQQQNIKQIQAGFVGNKSMIDNIFIIKITADRCVRSKQGCMWRWFLNLQKSCDPIKRDIMV